MPEPDGPQFADPDCEGGDCYRAAAHNVRRLERMGKQNVTVVHGIPTGGPEMDPSTGEMGVRIGHAWNEYDEDLTLSGGGTHTIRMVSDQSQAGDEGGLTLEGHPAEAYYNTGRIDPEESRVYTGEEANKRMIRSGHFGPWDNE